MRHAVFVAVSASLLAAPAVAQEAAPKTDWTKPVVGVDGNISPKRTQPTTTEIFSIEGEPLPVEVYSLEDLKNLPSRLTDVFTEYPTRTPQQPCDRRNPGPAVRCASPQAPPSPAPNPGAGQVHR